jgi:hypothetical protein
MPFGSKAVICSDDSSVEVNFDRVYAELLEPALKDAGCEPFRADSEVAAGDIRTDMFFELVTADIVVADLTSENVNVYYELGIRDGVSARGVFIITGLKTHRPFDVASDRSFTYPGALFSGAGGKDLAPEQIAEIRAAREELTQNFRQAIEADAQATGSPLYAHLPGLKSVDWQAIETSKARYFRALCHDWEERVRSAQARHRPGNILTLADDAPTRVHRIRILSHAAESLIGLCQFKAAEQVLTEIVQLAPDDLEAQHQLALVFANREKFERAESLMSDILRRQKPSEAGLVQGLLYRAMWYLKWTHDPNPRECAISQSHLLWLAVDKFHRAHREHPEQYLSGYNALLLMSVAKDLGIDAIPGLTRPSIDELTVVVRYIATTRHENAVQAVDGDALFWSAVCLAGLAMMENDQAASINWIQEACGLPTTTLFHLQSFQERIDFLQKLRYRTTIIEQIQTILAKHLGGRPQRAWNKVIVFYGQAAPFPRDSDLNVAQKIKAALQHWHVSPGDIGLCSAASVGDVTFAEACLALGADVRLLVPGDPSEDSRDSMSVGWVTRSYALADHPKTEVWNHDEELGPPADECDRIERNNRWILNTARMEADSSQNARLYALVLSDRAMEAPDHKDLSSFVSHVRMENLLRGVEVINPC